MDGGSTRQGRARAKVRARGKFWLPARARQNFDPARHMWVGCCGLTLGPVWLASGKNCMQTFACVWQKKIHVFGKLLHANSRCAGPDDLGGLTQSPVGPTNGPIPCPRCFHCHNQTHTIQATEFFPLHQPNKARSCHAQGTALQHRGTVN